MEFYQEQTFSHETVGLRTPRVKIVLMRKVFEYSYNEPFSVFKWGDKLFQVHIHGNHYLIDKSKPAIMPLEIITSYSRYRSKPKQTSNSTRPRLHHCNIREGMFGNSTS
ncbi:hypothetical protein NPIL_308671 [Nephila pilipes]|uniref:Uncharacterized protein n=1 Tax=Nephila pilipes TaxID=299642 RepID=A0A8X6PCX6_NEPPI|nr:hypothetical protein NPIL_308671 [Nephila pilipes]